MEITFSKDKISLTKKELNYLDQLVIDFTALLDQVNIKYVLVAGYISILFGRNRTSEDIDLITEKLTYDQFRQLWNIANKKFECLITKDPQEAYQTYLSTGKAIRFSRKGQFIPNLELKFTKNELDEWTLNARICVLLNQKHQLFISSLELQIPFKLFLGSAKDLEDARYLYRLFKDKLNLILLREFTRKLQVEDLFRKYLK